ncbi:MAG: hypothetical protein KatS3mg031_2044 [Chitinophagales bacterium]|nr:MAG: hypothetical protein KatS3mg031_2044 [Chitinophagales bacterium]
MKEYALEPDYYFLKEKSYNGQHPPYFNTADFPWVKELEVKYPEIINEVGGLLYGTEEMPTNLNPPYLSSPDAWRNLYFMNFRWINHKNCLRFPKTFSILRQIPNLSFAGITVLEPRSRVLPHIGETNAIIRCHLGLRVPGKDMDCGIRVNGEPRSHQEGKVLMFSDAHFHETWNNTDERRFILVFDVIQDQFAHKADWVCAKALGALTIKYMDARIPLINALPEWALRMLLLFFAVLWRIYLPVNRHMGIFYRIGEKLRKAIFYKDLSHSAA